MAKYGFCRRRGTLASCILAIALPLPAGQVFAQGLPAASARSIAIPAGSLIAAIRTIAEATDSEIVSIEPDLARIRTGAKKVPANPRHALDRLLRNTPYRAEQLGPASFRIERRPPEHHARAPASLPARPPASRDVIVVEGKFPTPIMLYPGSVVRFGDAARSTATNVPISLDQAAQSQPILQGTSFGEGRDKIFIRGIADSSFNSWTQPTTSVYFADALLGFGSPTPNIKLQDIAAVEVLEGPQGTLYGSGSIGGVIRITPNPVDLGRVSGSVTAGTSLSPDASPGWDTSGVINLPIVKSVAGLRLVGYGEHDGGYIDSPRLGRGLNGVDVAGGRASLRIAPGSGLELEATGLYQSTDAADAPYADMTGGLARRSAIRQPYSSEFALARFMARKTWDNGIALTAMASLGSRSARDTFDATLLPGPARAFHTERSTATFASETRLSSAPTKPVTWVIGLTYERIRDAQSRALGNPDAPPELDELTNITRSGSLFGQITFPLLQGLHVTAGARLTTARTDSEPSRGGVSSLIHGDSTTRVDPTLGMLWTAGPSLSVYGRIQTSYRNGGVAVAKGVGKVAEFTPDSIFMGELGLRWQRRDGTGPAISAAISYAEWDNVLAELVSARGFPYTTNIGNARILALEGSARWEFLPGLEGSASALYTWNRMTGPLPAQSPSHNRTLANVPAFSGTAGLRYGWGGAEPKYRIGASARYIGRSVLGPGALFDISQGNYALVDLYARARRGRYELALTVDNLLSSRARTFSLGNPLLVYRRDQSVPPPPTTVRLGVTIAW